MNVHGANYIIAAYILAFAVVVAGIVFVVKCFV